MDASTDSPTAGSPLQAQWDRGFRYEQAGSFERALETYAHALTLSATLGEQAESLIRSARVHRARAAYDAADRDAARALELADAAGDDDRAAEAMNVRVGSLQMQGMLDAADELARTALARARTPRVRGITIQNLGRGAAERGDFAGAEEYFRQSVAAFREASYDVGLMVALCNAAKAALDQHDVERALTIGNEAMALARRQNALHMLLTVAQNQAAAYAALGDYENAEGLLTEALGHFTTARSPGRQAECLELMGELSETGRGDRETALRCYRRALDLAVAANDRPLAGRLEERMRALSTLGGAARSS